MKLTTEQTEWYWRNGFLLMPDIFSADEVNFLNRQIVSLTLNSTDNVIWEENKENVRAIMGCHLHSPIFKNLVCQSRILEPAQQLLDSLVYVYQSKLNLKTAFGGDIWPWHQDFVYWHKLDGMPSPRALNISIFLDDCTEFNGPLWFIQQSHTEGILSSESDKKSNETRNWLSNVSADLDFKLDRKTISRLVSNFGIESPKGKAGSVLIFNPNIAHASLPNISPFDRKIFFVTYNSVLNAPDRKFISRPSFLVNPDSQPMQIQNRLLLDGD